jgi:quercetin dioxygenase-like cupin family protein
MARLLPAIGRDPMTPKLLLLAAALPFALFAAQPPQAQTDAAMAPDMASHVMLDASTLQWGDPPPALERGAQLAVLSGDPGKAGWFALRLKFPAGYKIALHWHPTAEHVTVLEGDFTLRMGDAPDEHKRSFGPGGYVVLPAHMHHAASTQDGALVQVAGMGPFVLNYVDPKDDPRLRTPAGASDDTQD